MEYTTKKLLINICFGMSMFLIALTISESTGIKELLLNIVYWILIYIFGEVRATMEVKYDGF